MSLGSDLLDAAKLVAREGYDQVSILAAEASFLRLISPKDAQALVSFEKLQISVAELRGVLPIPLFIGALSPASEVPPFIQESLAALRREQS
jgi:hypothetical protein